MKKINWVVVVALLFARSLVAQGGYMVGAGDVLNITVFGEPDLSGKFAVDQDGAIAFPQLGRVKTAGMTLREVEEALKTQLADGLLKSPQVAAAVRKRTDRSACSSWEESGHLASTSLGPISRSSRRSCAPAARPRRPVAKW